MHEVSSFIHGIPGDGAWLLHWWRIPKLLCHKLLYPKLLYPKLLLTYYMDSTVMMNYLLTVHVCGTDQTDTFLSLLFCDESCISALLYGPDGELC